jgi:hypothetical protein
MSGRPVRSSVAYLLGTVSLVYSPLNKAEKVPIDHFCLSCAHAMGEALVHLKGHVLNQPGSEEGGICNGDHLVVIAVHDERGYRDLCEVPGKSVSEKALMQS